MPETYEVIIIGGGPGGLTAGLYAARARRRTLLIEKGVAGGQVATTDRLENFPGFPDGVGGMELGELMAKQATRFGLEMVTAEVTRLAMGPDWKTVKTTEGEYQAPAIIIASGAEYRKLGVPGEKELTGKGVSYCAVCDAAFFPRQEVAVVGGGDTALTEALFITKFASRVYVIHRRRQLRAEKILRERALAHSRITFLWDKVVEAIQGDDEVKSLTLRDVTTGERSSLAVSGVFISIGLVPSTGFLKGVLPLDASSHILTNDRMETGVPGVYAVGDVRANSAQQAITAAGDGAVAALAADQYLSERA